MVTTIYGIWLVRKDGPNTWLSLSSGEIFYTGHLKRARAQRLTIVENPAFKENKTDGDGYTVVELQVREIGEGGKPTGKDLTDGDQEAS